MTHLLDTHATVSKVEKNEPDFNLKYYFKAKNKKAKDIKERC